MNIKHFTQNINQGRDFISWQLNKLAKKLFVASSRQHKTEAKSIIMILYQLINKKQKDLRLFSEVIKRFSSPQQP